MRLSPVLAIALAACGAAPPDTDAAIAGDAFTPAVDAYVAPVDANTACDVSPAPSGLVALTGDFVPLEADAGSPIAVQTGGDPTGVWRISHITFYTAVGTAGMYDVASSSVTGTAWIVADATTLRIELSLDLVLAGTAAGTIRRHQTTDIRGTYTIDGAMLDMTAECVSPPPMSSSTAFAPMFTAGASDGTLVLVTSGMLGETTLVLTGTRTPS